MPQDKQVYSELDKRTWTQMPNLVRWRHRFRGVRESVKVNQEIAQITYDLYSLNKTLDTFFEELNVLEDEMYGGKNDFVDVAYLYDDTEEFPATYAHDGFNNLSERLASIRKAIVGLENG